MALGSDLEGEKSEKLRLKLGIEGVDGVVRRGRLRWFGHVERKEADDWVSKCRKLEVVGGVKKKGRGRKTWLECVTKDMKECGLKEKDAQDRSLRSRKLLLVTSNPRFSVDKLM